MVDLTDAELDGLVRYLQTAPSMAARNAAAAITALRARIAELEACIDLVIPDDCKSQLHEDATNMVKLQARIAELEAQLPTPKPSQTN